MFSKTVFGAVFFAMAVLAPVTLATASDKYDPYNRCGAPFCASTGGAAAAAAVARMDRHKSAGTLNDKPIGEPIEKPSRV